MLLLLLAKVLRMLDVPNIIRDYLTVHSMLHSIKEDLKGIKDDLKDKDAVPATRFPAEKKAEPWERMESLLEEIKNQLSGLTNEMKGLRNDIPAKTAALINKGKRRAPSSSSRSL